MSYPLLDVFKGVKTPVRPVWLMRQAGRVLPEYRRLRSKYKDFKTLLKTPELAAEISLQPISRWGVDGTILFSDILVLAEAMGSPYEFLEDRGPYFPEPITNPQVFSKLREVDVETDLSYVLETLRLLRISSPVPVIGFSAAPWTLFAYMTEGMGTKTFSRARSIFYSQPDFSKKFLDLLTTNIISYLRAQIEAGAQVLQIFDSLAGFLPPSIYKMYILPHIHLIVESLVSFGVPLIFFPKGLYSLWDEMGSLSVGGVGLDWQVSPQEVIPKLSGKVLQGNMDPALLYGSQDRIRKETHNMLDSFCGVPHIVNLGHGLYPDTDWTHVSSFVKSVREYSS
ncbi:MAG: uroporphyrinogen decarboxylase [Cytophagales bacterium]|nr:uroporphyrinogen decarboxylase [Cytophagales bacterium]